MSRTLSAVALVMVVIGCERPNGSPPSQAPAKKVTAADVQKDSQKAAETAREYTAQQMEEYQRKLKDELDKLDRQLDAWKAKARDAAAEIRAKLEPQIKALEEQRAAAQQRFEEFKKSAQPAWNDLRQGMDRAWNDLRAAFEKAREHFNGNAARLAQRTRILL
jgi:hypothetical protein